MFLVHLLHMEYCLIVLLNPFWSLLSRRIFHLLVFNVIVETLGFSSPVLKFCFLCLLHLFLVCFSVPLYVFLWFIWIFFRISFSFIYWLFSYTSMHLIFQWSRDFLYIFIFNLYRVSSVTLRVKYKNLAALQTHLPAILHQESLVLYLLCCI